MFSKSYSNKCSHDYCSTVTLHETLHKLNGFYKNLDHFPEHVKGELEMSVEPETFGSEWRISLVNKSDPGVFKPHLACLPPAGEFSRGSRHRAVCCRQESARRPSGSVPPRSQSCWGIAKQSALLCIMRAGRTDTHAYKAAERIHRIRSPPQRFSAMQQSFQFE